MFNPKAINIKDLSLTQNKVLTLKFNSFTPMALKIPKVV